jgi:hypothetical protein
MREREAAVNRWGIIHQDQEYKGTSRINGDRRISTVVSLIVTVLNQYFLIQI